MSSDSEVPVRDALRGAVSALDQAGVPAAHVDAELLLAWAIGSDVSRGEVQAAAIRGDNLSAEQHALLREAIVRRSSREPLQHITGTAPFRRMTLDVGPGVFVPRPETEMVAQLAIDALAATADPEPVAVDLGTGSGAIALAMATEVPHARVHAVERSDEAIAWTRRNVARIAPHIDLRHGDLADAFDDLVGTVSVVASNPPYVPDEAIPRDDEVRLYDPAAALYGGVDGLDVVRIISRVGLRLARQGGAIVLEHGERQGQQIREILTSDGWQAAATHRDLTSRDRATTALRP
ncbi:peptide chain release factor N(5)-glutamine methyltransferase [Microbacterium amylolyticum]|uniref:Release factor glutamine methyltransferase n=1 Tax=Microbacterium amylolyticum TaxID=936337 RepID=A0ABS4ZGS8_9MICO|nr:peptide chain release factor N(5)-glutamine methyltransferase [Microbacterium amylolyticum]MBP2436248.1 release factor glutamine methyltransferase [Microbacterium amylolyticum]